jgi:hypothetical protein
MDMTDQFPVSLFDLGNSGYMFFRDDQNMDRSDRIPVPEGQDQIVFMDNPGRRFLRYDIAENTTHMEIKLLIEFKFYLVRIN